MLLDLPNAVLAKILALFADGSRMFGRDCHGNHVFGAEPVRGWTKDALNLAKLDVKSQ